MTALVWGIYLRSQSDLNQHFIFFSQNARLSVTISRATKRRQGCGVSTEKGARRTYQPCTAVNAMQSVRIDRQNRSTAHVPSIFSGREWSTDGQKLISLLLFFKRWAILCDISFVSVRLMLNAWVLRQMLECWQPWFTLGCCKLKWRL